MAGYVGTKAVLLSTTAANVGGAASIGGDLTVDTSTLHVDSTNNRVGIGTSSPTGKLQVVGAANSDVFYLTDANEDDRGLMFSNSSNGIIWDIDAKGAAGSFGQISFSTNSSEAMRLDSSGNLLVGTTDSLPATNNDASGIALRSDGNEGLVLVVWGLQVEASL